MRLGAASIGAAALVLSAALLFSACGTKDEGEMNHGDGDVLFEDPLDGSVASGWRVAPERFTEHPELGATYLLESGGERTIAKPPWAGDESWVWYRVEFDVCATGDKDGWVGVDYHVSDDGSGCNNLQFRSNSGDPRAVFETAGRWDSGNLSWKLFPFGQRVVSLPKGEWAHVRVDVGDTFANVYVNGESEPCYTVRYLPFLAGGIRFWNYYGSAWLRDLRVVALAEGEIEPVLEGPWDSVVDGNVIRGWRITRALPEGTGDEDGLGAASSGTARWRDAVTDARGIVNVTAAGPEYRDRCVVFAKAVIESQEKTVRGCSLTYTDRASIWLNGAPVFDGEPRGWNDPGRSVQDGFGRLLPGQFSVELPLRAGENDLLVRLEVNEPAFGSGFWIRLD